MSDLEERPSKIRKLETIEIVGEVNSSEEPGTEHNSCSVPNPSTEPLTSVSKDGQNDGVEAPSSTDLPEAAPRISKSQQKRLEKQRKWDEGLEERRAKRRLDRKAKQERKRAAYENVEAAEGEGVEKLPPKPEPFRKGPPRPIPVPMAIILDCDFETYMVDKELVSLSSQLTRSYSENKKNSYRTHLVISSWGGILQKRFETVLANAQLGWKGVTFSEKRFDEAGKDIDVVMRGVNGGKLVGALAGVQKEVASADNGKEVHCQGTNSETSIASSEIATGICSSKGSEVAPEYRSLIPSATSPLEGSEPQMVYLTADSPNTLARLHPNTSYIVGAIVDKNRYKGLCYKRACELGIPTAKLPIGEYMTMQSRSVLTVNHVVEIMLKWLETGDWGEAFLAVIPKRKEAKLRNLSTRLDNSTDKDAEESIIDSNKSEKSIYEDGEGPPSAEIQPENPLGEDVVEFSGALETTEDAMDEDMGEAQVAETKSAENS